MFETVWASLMDEAPGPFSLSAVIEQLVALALSPLAYAGHRQPIEDRVLVSDASEKGGAVAYSLGLTPVGRLLVEAGSKDRRAWSLDYLAVATMGDTVGGCFRALEMGGHPPGAAGCGRFSPNGRALPDFFGMPRGANL